MVFDTLDRQSILFAGSGFSFGAINIFGKPLPSGNELRDILAKDCDIFPTPHGLGKVADYYIGQKGISSIIKIIKDNCTSITHKSYHEEITSLPWKRIYTTNYDKVIENSASTYSLPNIISPITYSDDFSTQKKNDICIHINGFIDRLNLKTFNNEFRLTDSSYLSESLVNNSWYQFMVNDFIAAKTIIVIGYSMDYDIDILRLFSLPEIKEKVFFITSPTSDPITIDKFNNYGFFLPIGIEEFGTKVKEFRNKYTPSFEIEYRCFDYQYHKVLQAKDPTYEEIVNSYIFGKFSDNLLIKDQFNNYKFLIKRTMLNMARDNYLKFKILLILSDLGNGKTLFCQLFENEMRSEDVIIARLKHNYEEIDLEIESICSSKKHVIIIIDDYHNYFKILQRFYEFGISNITFMLTSRIAINNISYRKLLNTLHLNNNQVKPIYINYLDKNETDYAEKIFKENSLKLKLSNNEEIRHHITGPCKSIMSAILVSLFNSSDIKQRLINLYKTIDDLKDRKLMQVAVFLLIQSVSNAPIEFFDLLDLLKADYLNFQKSESEFLSEIFDVESGNPKVKSSIIAREILRSAIGLNKIIEVMIEVFTLADERESDKFEELQKNLVSHSQFIRLLENNSQTKDSFIEIEYYYDSIRNTNFAKKNPLFWEQFASAYLDAKNYPLAKHCLDHALEISNNLRWFVPYQVKTVYGRYFLELCIDQIQQNNYNPDLAIQSIIDAERLITEHFNHPDNNVFYVFKVARNFSIIFNFEKSYFDNRMLSIYIEKSTKIIRLMDNYLSINSNSQYFEKVKIWKNEINNTINDAKNQIQNNLRK